MVEREEGQSFGRNIALYRASDYALVSHIHAQHTSRISCLCFSPDGLHLVSGSWDNTIRLWKLRTGKCQLVLGEHSGVGEVKKFNINSDRRWIEYKGFVESISYRSDGLQLASGSDDCIIRLWDVKTGQCQAVLKGHEQKVTSISYRPDGLQLASSSRDKTIRLWNMKTKQCQSMLKHSHAVTSISYRPDGLQLASGSDDYVIRLWDVKTGQCQAELKGHTYNVGKVNYRPDGSQLASCGVGNEDYVIRLWDIQTRKCQAVLEGHTKEIKYVCYHPDGSRLVSSSDDNTIRLWNLKKGYTQTILEGHTQAIKIISYRPDGLQLASGSWDKTVRLWNVQKGQCQAVLRKHAGKVNSITYSNNGLQLVSAADKIVFWDSLTSKIQKIWNERITPISYHPDGLQLASGSWDNAIRLWEIKTGQCYAVLEGHKSTITSICYRPDGLQLASGSSDKSIRLWEIKTRRCYALLEGHKSTITSICYRPDGLQLASGNDDNIIRLWDVKTGQCQAELKGHKYGITSISYCPNGLQLASSSKDNTIRLWNIKAGECIGTINYKSTAYSLCWQPCHLAASSKAFFLSAGCGDGSLKTWRIEFQQLKVSVQLVWSSVPIGALQSYYLELQGVAGLKEQDYILLQQRGNNTAKGQLSKANVQQIIEQRNGQKYIPNGVILIKRDSGFFEITSQQWLISMVREKIGLQASSQSSMAEGHVYLILQGLDERKYTIIKEFHLFLDTSTAKFFNTRGKAVIKIYDSSPWLLKEKQSRLIARQWIISAHEAQNFIQRIEQQQKSKSPTYSVSGKAGHNCLSWCVKQLGDANIPIETQPTWRSFFAAVPSDYLPETKEENNTDQNKNCLVM